MKKTSFGPALLCAAWGTVACGSSAPAPQAAAASNVQCPAGQSFDGQYCVAAASTPPPPATSAQPVDERPVEEPAPAPAAVAVAVTPAVAAAPARSLAAPVDVTMASAAAPLIQYLAQAHLPAGAHAFGAPFAGQFTEGQVLDQRVQLTVGKCYTVVAAGTPPVEELNVGLYAVGGEPPGPSGAALAQDKEKGPQAVLGRKTECFKPTVGQTELVLVLQVEKGRGVGAAQVFEK